MSLLVRILLLLPLGVELVEDRLAGVRFVDEAVQGAHHDVGVDVTVVRHERADPFQPRVVISGVVCPRQQVLAEAIEGRVLHDVVDAMADGQVIILRLRFHGWFRRGRGGRDEGYQFG